VEWLELHRNQKTYVVSRLDKDTSGVLLLARSRAASGEAERIHKEGLASKSYLFVTDRQPPPVGSAWVVDTALDNKSAMTHFRIIESWQNGLHLCEANLSAGRLHQVRRHAAQSGLPVLGDPLYGGTKFARVCLHARSITWPGVDGPIAAPLPASFAALQSSNSGALESQRLLTSVAMDRRQGTLRDITNTMRLLHRGEGGADCSVDRFGSSWCVWDYDEENATDTSEILATLGYLPTDPIVNKRLIRNPHRNGSLARTTIVGEPGSLDKVTLEHELSYNIDLGGQDQTGFFIDQRDNRRRVMNTASGKDIANLFCYTCSFSVAAAAGGCSNITSVDNSHAALGQGIANFRTNNLERPGHTKFIKEDVRVWLKKQHKRGQRYDLIICDPPTFASGSGSGSQPFRISDKWLTLAQDISQLLQTGGEALFCTNSRTLPTEHLEQPLLELFSKVTRHRTPFDFPEAVDPHHNRFFWCSK
jgi:23S rRNA (cytosine1962-C5)-methyltransferase